MHDKTLHPYWNPHFLNKMYEEEEALSCQWITAVVCCPALLGQYNFLSKPNKKTLVGLNMNIKRTLIWCISECRQEVRQTNSRRTKRKRWKHSAFGAVTVKRTVWSYVHTRHVWCVQERAEYWFLYML